MSSKSAKKKAKSKDVGEGVVKRRAVAKKTTKPKTLARKVAAPPAMAAAGGVTKLQTESNVLALINRMRWDRGHRDNKEYKTNWKTLRIESDLWLTRDDMASFAEEITRTYTRPNGGGAVGVAQARNAGTLKDLVDVVHAVF